MEISLDSQSDDFYISSEETISDVYDVCRILVRDTSSLFMWCREQFFSRYVIFLWDWVVIATSRRFSLPVGGRICIGF